MSSMVARRSGFTISIHLMRPRASEVCVGSRYSPQLYTYKDWSRHSDLALPTAIALQRAEGPKIVSNITPTSKNRVREMRKGAGSNDIAQSIQEGGADHTFNEPCTVRSMFAVAPFLQDAFGSFGSGFGCIFSSSFLDGLCNVIFPFFYFFQRPLSLKKSKKELAIVFQDTLYACRNGCKTHFWMVL